MTDDQSRWAWQDPHVTKKIAADERVDQPVKVRKLPRSKKSAKPSEELESDASDSYRTYLKRPQVTHERALSTLHLLLCSPSFTRLPLALRFFCKDVYGAWCKHTEQVCGELRSDIPILLQAKPIADPMDTAEQPVSSQVGPKRKFALSGVGGIEDIDVSYKGLKANVEKSISLLDEQGPKTCAICDNQLGPQNSAVVICPSERCQAMSHIACLAKKTSENSPFAGFILPMMIQCTQCDGQHAWVDLVREWSIRMRGAKDLAQLMKVPRGRKSKVAKSSMSIKDPNAASEDRLTIGENHVFDSVATAADFLAIDVEDDPLPDDWHELGEDSDNESVASTDVGISSHHETPKRTREKRQQLPVVIEDSEWDSAEVLD